MAGRWRSRPFLASRRRRDRADAALEKLLELAANAGLPLTLAVIPASTGEGALSTRLADERHVLVALHGWSHTNHAGLQARKSRNLARIARGYRAW